MFFPDLKKKKVTTIQNLMQVFIPYGDDIV